MEQIDGWIAIFILDLTTTLVEGLMLKITVKLSYKFFGFMLNKIQFIKSTTSSKKVFSHSFVTDGTYSLRYVRFELFHINLIKHLKIYITQVA